MPTYSNPYPSPNPYMHSPYPPYPPYMPIAPPSLTDTSKSNDEEGDNTKHVSTPAAYTVPPHYLYPPYSPSYMYPGGMMGSSCSSYYPPPYMGAVAYHPSFQYPPAPVIPPAPCANDPFAHCDQSHNHGHCHPPEPGCYDEELFAPPHDANVCHSHTEPHSHSETSVEATCTTSVQTTPVQTAPVQTAPVHHDHHHTHDDHHHPYDHHPHSHHHPHHHPYDHCQCSTQEETPTCPPPVRHANITCIYHDEEDDSLPKEAYILRIPRNKDCSAYVYPKPE